MKGEGATTLQAIKRPHSHYRPQPPAVGGTFDLLAGVCGRLRALRALISMTALAYGLCVTCILVQFAPQYYRSAERMFPGRFAPGNLVPGKVPGNILGSESSQWELSLRGAKIPGSEKSLNRQD